MFLVQGFSIECVRRPERLSDRIVGEKILLGRSGRLNVPCGRVCPPGERYMCTQDYLIRTHKSLPGAKEAAAKF